MHPGPRTLHPEPCTLEDQFGPIDIYLFDQLLRGRIQPGMRVLDAGCAEGFFHLKRKGVVHVK